MTSPLPVSPNLSLSMLRLVWYIWPVLPCVFQLYLMLAYPLSNFLNNIRLNPFEFGKLGSIELLGLASTTLVAATSGLILTAQTATGIYTTLRALAARLCKCHTNLHVVV